MKNIKKTADTYISNHCKNITKEIRGTIRLLKPSIQKFVAANKNN